MFEAEFQTTHRSRFRNWSPKYMTGFGVVRRSVAVHSNNVMGWSLASWGDIFWCPWGCRVDLADWKLFIR